MFRTLPVGIWSGKFETLRLPTLPWQDFSSTGSFVFHALWMISWHSTIFASIYQLIVTILKLYTVHHYLFLRSSASRDGCIPGLALPRKKKRQEVASKVQDKQQRYSLWGLPTYRKTPGRFVDSHLSQRRQGQSPTQYRHSCRPWMPPKNNA